MSQLQLFKLSKEEETLPVIYTPNFLTSDEADQLFAYSKTLPWQQNRIRIIGKWVELPRQEVMYGDAGCNYIYSNSVELVALPWTQELNELKDRVEKVTGYCYNIVIGNHYQTGSDYIGWHSDNEPSMGPLPAIASISLGAGRKFQLRKKGKGTTIHDYWLGTCHEIKSQPLLVSSSAQKDICCNKAGILFLRISLGTRFFTAHATRMPARIYSSVTQKQYFFAKN